MVGETLNHYKIVSQLGRGGMGEVYVAEDTKLDRRVALKVLPPEMAADSERRTRFEREAKAVASLNHPNIVTVYSVEQAGDRHFITMELVEGPTLSDILTEKSLPLKRLLDYAVELADAVTGAHRKGITHRDLKPDNVMLAEDGRIKVLDFGLAKLTDGGSVERQETALPTQTVTQEGKILGTVAYMSPEQAEGKPVDARSDVFSLGVVLYQMATGERPFGGDTSISTITSILRDRPQSITQLNNSLPRHLARIVQRCLEKDPERRYQTAQDLRNDLQGLREELDSGELSGSDIAVAPPAARPRQSWLIAGLGVVAVAAIALAVVQVTGRGSSETPAPQPAAGVDMVITRLTATGEAREATISPDGRYVVFVMDEAGQSSMWVTQVSTGSKVQIISPAEVGLWDPTFSLDGEFIYYCRYESPDPHSALYRIATLGGAPRKVMDDVGGRVSFSPDGQRFVFNRGDPEQDTLVVADVDGGNEKVIATRRSPASYDDPSWSPDGSIIAASLSTFSGGPRATVITVPAEGGEERTITDRSWFGVGELAWFPDGSGLVANVDSPLTSELWEISYPGGQARRIITDLNSYHGAGLTADGTTLVTQLNESSYNLWTLSPDDTVPAKRITSGTKNAYGSISWTPDGRIVHDSNAGGNLDIWIVNADGSDPTQLTANDELNADPVVTSDGEYVVFLSNRAGTVNIWRMDLEGGSAVQLTQGDLDVSPDVSPDGQWVVYFQPGSGTVHRVSITGGESTKIRDRRSRGPLISPDGTRILLGTYYEDEQRWKIDIIPFDGGDPIQTIDEPDLNSVQWAPDGKAVTYVHYERDVGNVWRLPLEGGDPVQLTHFDSDGISDYAWSHDGKQLALSRGHSNQDIVLLKNFR